MILFFMFITIQSFPIQTNPRYGELAGKYNGGLIGAAAMFTPAGYCALFALAQYVGEGNITMIQRNLRAAACLIAATGCLASGAYVGGQIGGYLGRYLDSLANQ